MKSVKILASATVLAGCLSAAHANEPTELVSMGQDRTGVAVTIYNDSLALIRESRKLSFEEGINRFALRDVSALMRPETATLTSKGDAKLSLLEQNFDFDLLTPSTLFNKYVGKEVTIVTHNPKTDYETSEKAIILSNNDGVVLKYADRIETGLPANARIQYTNVPANLRDRPTLTADIASDKKTTEVVDLSYLTSGLSWKADYVAELSNDENTLSLAGWVTLTNRSGTDYENARLQLVAGDVNQVRGRMEVAPVMMLAKKDVMVREKAIQTENLFEYHLYTLNRSTTLRNNQTKQVALLSASQVPVKKLYRMKGGDQWYYRSNGQFEQPKKRDVEVYVSFQNEKDANLGMALPKGVVRVYKPDSAGNALFIGEDAIDHTPEKQNVTLKLGNAFDVTGTWKRTDYQRISKNVIQQSFEVELSNAKDIPVDVSVVEPIFQTWQVTSENIKHTKPTFNAAQWVVPVPAKDKATLKFTVRVRED